MGFKTKHLQREEVKMADNVSFKVYLKDPSQGEELEVRRFVVDKEVSTSLVYIKEKLVSIFPVLADKIFSVSWTVQEDPQDAGEGRAEKQVDVETPGGQRTTVKPSAKTDKAEEDEQDKAASPEAAKEESASPSDDEEWTVLSDKKPEAEAVQIPIQVLDKEVAPVYPTLPAEDSTTSSSTPRNTTTSANETQDQGAAAPASAPPATAVHPDPRIQVALQAMMNIC